MYHINACFETDEGSGLGTAESTRITNIKKNISFGICATFKVSPQFV